MKKEPQNSGCDGVIFYFTIRDVLCRDAWEKEAILTIVQFNVHAIMEFI